MSIHPQVACQSLSNSYTRIPVPEFRTSRFRELPFDQGLGRGKNGGGVLAQETVGPLRNRNGALRVGSQCKTGNSKRGRLLLNPAAVRDEQARLIHETQEVEIPQGIHDVDS